MNRESAVWLATIALAGVNSGQPLTCLGGDGRTSCVSWHQMDFTSTPPGSEPVP